MRLVLTGQESDSFEHVVAYLHSLIICFFKYLFALTVRSNLIPSPPTYNSKYGYLSWESYYNLSYYTRLLPPVPEDCPTPLGVRGLSLFHQAAPINILHNLAKESISEGLR